MFYSQIILRLIWKQESNGYNYDSLYMIVLKRTTNKEQKNLNEVIDPKIPFKIVN